MFRKQTRSWVTAAVVSALFLTASPGSAAALPWQGQLASAWEGLWARVVPWFGGAPAAPGQTKTSGCIDPLGRPVCSASSAGIRPNGRPRPVPPLSGQTKTCASINPDGQPMCSSTSSSIDPLGQPH